MEVMQRRDIKILCVQETKWKRNTAREIGEGYKVYYSGERCRDEEKEEYREKFEGYMENIARTELIVIAGDMNAGQNEMQIDYIMVRKEDRCLVMDCKVKPRESVVTQHTLVVEDFRTKEEDLSVET
ncbi:uncharacterized protein LOC143039725 [Oratosquilla oratoria]|uniref:uncharacterized protein LOC143039725 n=1 Tax=Oratosquilla oratoria TaxID=337810 RepID=UPI003F7615E5